jgi:hypothetical protein
VEVDPLESARSKREGRRRERQSEPGACLPGVLAVGSIAAAAGSHDDGLADAASLTTNVAAELKAVDTRDKHLAEDHFGLMLHDLGKALFAVVCLKAAPPCPEQPPI